MPLSVLDIYREILPKTNCGRCGFPSCLAFAGMVVSEKVPLEKCPYIPPETAAAYAKKLELQYAEGKWTRRDPAEDALVWAKQRSASMKIQDLPDRIGGRLVEWAGQPALELPYFNQTILISGDQVIHQDGTPLNHWEQVFIFNHLAQGGKTVPTGRWKGLGEFPNTVSKISSMKNHVEIPLQKAFGGEADRLRAAALSLGAQDLSGQIGSADLALYFPVLPRVPVLLMFWDADDRDGFEAEVRLLFDETVTEHLDIESIMFLSERLQQLLGEETSSTDHPPSLSGGRG